jgi:hypothetical protein
MKPRPIRKDVLEEFGRKNVDDYILTDMEIQQMQMAASMQQAPETGEGPPA